MKKYEEYYVNIKWMAIVLPVLGVGIYEVFRYHVFSKIFDDITNSIILMLSVGFFGYLFATWLFKRIQAINDTLFWEENRLKAIFTHTSDGIIVLGENCEILDINPAAEIITGWKAKDVVGKMNCDQMTGCSKSKETCWNSLEPESCMNVDCGHRECWGKTCLEKKISIPFVEMCLLKKNGKKIKIAASYSYIPAIGEEKPQVKLVLRDISERKKFEKAIQNYATLEERYRLAREIHDGLAQTLVYMNLKAHNIQKCLETENYQVALKDIIEFRQVAQEAVDEVRQNIFDLKASPGEERSCFRVWLEEYLNYFSTTNHIEKEFKCNCTKALILPTETKVQLMRIVQEALTNIRKHARATKASIYLSKTDNQINLKIMDNGQGINFVELKEKQTEHFGLTIMQERAQLIGGSLEIKPNDPRGTLVELKVNI